MEEKEKYFIPRNVEARFEVVQNIPLRDLVFFLPSVSVVLILFFFIPITPLTKFSISSFLLVIPAALIYIRPYKKWGRHNIQLRMVPKYHFRFLTRQKTFFYKKKGYDMIFNKEERKAKKEREQRQKSIQEWINVKDIHSDMIITRDNRLIKMLQVNTVNTQLMSDREIKDIFRRYENFLRSTKDAFQITVVSQPVDLSEYIDQQKMNLQKTKDEHKKRLLRAYIDYNRELELSESVVQRKRYLILEEKIKNDSQDAYDRAEKRLGTKIEAISKSLSMVGLSSDIVSNIELIQYLHSMYDFKSSQKQPIESETIPQVISYKGENTYDEVASTIEEE